MEQKLYFCDICGEKAELWRSSLDTEYEPRVKIFINPDCDFGLPPYYKNKFKTDFHLCMNHLTELKKFLKI